MPINEVSRAPSYEATCIYCEQPVCGGISYKNVLQSLQRHQKTCIKNPNYISCEQCQYYQIGFNFTEDDSDCWCQYAQDLTKTMFDRYMLLHKLDIHKARAHCKVFKKREQI